MPYQNDQRIVLTLDAGGTNFVFSAMQANKFIVEPVRKPSNAHDLDLCLNTIVDGFSQVKEQLTEAPVAISFAFPGPADYPAGIIGDLPNLKAFRGGIALGPMLQEKFNLPVFINNDGDLNAYGEALAGYLPYLNQKLEEASNPKRFKNLIGITLGTGFGCGVVNDGRLYVGDNLAAESWIMSTRFSANRNVEEEGVAIRAVQRVYAQQAGVTDPNSLSPKDIYDIAKGTKPGNATAAQAAFAHMGRTLGDAVANLITLFDGIVVIGGGVSGARDLIVPALMQELKHQWESYEGDRYVRLVQEPYYLNNPAEFELFLKGNVKNLPVWGSSKTISIDMSQRVGIAFSDADTSHIISLGAYAFALNQLS